MSGSPAVILFDASGNAMAVADGVAIPANTKSLLVAGKDAGGVARTLATDTSGQLKATVASLDASIETSGAAVPAKAQLTGGTDGTNIRVLKTDSAGKLQVGLGALTGWQASQLSVSTSAVQVASSPLANRKTISLKAVCYVDSLGTSDLVYIGNGSGVTSATGYALRDGETVDLDLDATAVIYAISSALRVPSNGLYILEIA